MTKNVVHNILYIDPQQNYIKTEGKFYQKFKSILLLPHFSRSRNLISLCWSNLLILNTVKKSLGGGGCCILMLGVGELIANTLFNIKIFSNIILWKRGRLHRVITAWLYYVFIYVPRNFISQYNIYKMYPIIIFC